MTKHLCNKEVEIAVMQTDVKYIREKIDIIGDQVVLNTKFRNQA